MKLLYASDQSAHWYSRDGLPQHTIVGANGKERPTTLRDSRKFGWLPSVTSILKVINSDILTDYKLNQALLASLDNPIQDGESKEDWMERVTNIGKQDAKDAAAKGSIIHGVAENLNVILKTEICPGLQDISHLDPDIQTCYRAYEEWAMENINNVLSAEEVLVHVGVGFAGTVDVVYVNKKGQVVMGDIKTIRSKGRKRYGDYQKWLFQMCSYKAAWESSGRPLIEKIENIKISTDEPGRLEICDWPKEQWEDGWEAFKACKTIWSIENNYWPERHGN